MGSNSRLEYQDTDASVLDVATKTHTQNDLTNLSSIMRCF